MDEAYVDVIKLMKRHMLMTREALVRIRHQQCLDNRSYSDACREAEHAIWLIDDCLNECAILLQAVGEHSMEGVDPQLPFPM